MSSLNKSSFLKVFLSYLPLIFLFVSVFNEFDFKYLEIDNFSFDFVHILIFFWTLKNLDRFGYLSIFFAGVINDVVVGIPIGVSSFCYLILCSVTAYIRNITIRPSPMKDWFYFLFIISLINSLNYSVLTLFFSYDLVLMSYLVNTTCTFLLYIIFLSFFKYYMKGIND